MANILFMISLVLSLCTSLSISTNVFISIDCGSSFEYRDENGIVWEGDDKYMQSGEAVSIQPPNSIGHVADTLRVFTTRKKNCYHIDSVKQGRVLVRASFYYGNYDGKSLPPTFDLQFDGNYWTQVQTSSTQSYDYEVNYVMKRDSISVCLAQTEKGQFPFISALEIRSLESYMYNHIDNSYPLLVWRRFAFGSNTTTRYKEDPYDRLWGPGSIGKGSIPVLSDAIFSEQPSPDDNPPAAVLKNAVAATSPNASMELKMEFPSYEISAYINLYFSEVTQLGPSQNRSFRIFKDNESFSDPILPPYGDCTQLWVSDIVISNETVFTLVPTNVSTLSPLINAVEIFEIGDTKLTDGTNNKDVEGLASLQESFSVLRSWSGDPCLPTSYTWDWIQCSDDPIPRVTALLLSDYGLSGLLPDFSSMDALQTIDFHNNSLRGHIPEFLGTLPDLKTLNLAKNQLNGTVPPSLSTKKDLILTLAGNSLQLPPPPSSTLFPPSTATFGYPFLSPSPPFQGGGGGGGGGFGSSNMPDLGGRKKSKLPKILKITIPPSSIISIVGAIYGICRCRRRRQDQNAAAATAPAHAVG